MLEDYSFFFTSVFFLNHISLLTLLPYLPTVILRHAVSVFFTSNSLIRNDWNSRTITPGLPREKED